MISAVLLGGWGFVGWRLTSAHRRALQLQAVSIVNEAVQDGVRQPWLTGCQCSMPVLDRQLADDQCRANLAAIVDDLEQILGFDDVRRRQ